MPSAAMRSPPTCSRWKRSRVYLQHLKPSGVIAVHTSNRHLNLRPIVALIAQHYQMQVMAVYAEDERRRGRLGDRTGCWSPTTKSFSDCRDIARRVDAARPAGRRDSRVDRSVQQLVPDPHDGTEMEEVVVRRERDGGRQKTSRSEAGRRRSFPRISAQTATCAAAAGPRAV